MQVCPRSDQFHISVVSLGTRQTAQKKFNGLETLCYPKKVNKLGREQGLFWEFSCQDLSSIAVVSSRQFEILNIC